MSDSPHGVNGPAEPSGSKQAPRTGEQAAVGTSPHGVPLRAEKPARLPPSERLLKGSRDLPTINPTTSSSIESTACPVTENKAGPSNHLKAGPSGEPKVSRAFQRAGPKAWNSRSTVSCQDKKDGDEKIPVYRRSETWDQRATSYDEWSGLQWHKVFANKAIKWIQPCKGTRVLDLACGTGEFSLLVSKAVGNEGLVCSVDFSAGMLAQFEAKKAAAMPSSNNILIIRHNITELRSSQPLKSFMDMHGRFQLLTCFACLDLLPDPHKQLRSWAGFLLKDGYLVVDVPSARDSLSHVLSDFEISLGVSEQHTQSGMEYRKWTQPTIEKAFAGTGLRILKMWTTDSLGTRRDRFDRDAVAYLFTSWKRMKDYTSIYGAQKVKSKWNEVWDRHLSGGQVVYDWLRREVVVAKMDESP